MKTIFILLFIFAASPALLSTLPSFAQESPATPLAHELINLIMKQGLEKVVSANISMQASELEMEEKYEQACALRDKQLKSEQKNDAVLVKKIDLLLENIVQLDANMGQKLTPLVTKMRLKTKSSLAYLYINRGACYGGAKKYELALKDFGKAIKLQPEAVEGYKGRGIFYMQHGQKAKAIADFEMMIKLDPDGAGGDSARMFIGVLK